jgi:hypothetical protein
MTCRPLQQIEVVARGIGQYAVPAQPRSAAMEAKKISGSMGEGASSHSWTVSGSVAGSKVPRPVAIRRLASGISIASYASYCR